MKNKHDFGAFNFDFFSRYNVILKRLLSCSRPKGGAFWILPQRHCRIRCRNPASKVIVIRLSIASKETESCFCFFFQHLNDCLLFLVGLESRCFYLTRRLLLFTIEEIMWSIVILFRLSKYLLVSNLPSNYSFVRLNFRLTGINVASEEGSFYIDPVLPQDDIPGVGSVGKHCEYKW